MNDVGNIAEVKPFSSNYKAAHKVLIVDVETQYDNKCFKGHQKTGV